MLIYHGSKVPVEVPKIMGSKRKLDFGEGFYATFNREQAIRWSVRVSKRLKTDIQVISEFEFDIEAAEKKLRVIRFEQPDEIWLDFVSANRNSHVIPEPYDIVMGAVANDIVYTTVTLYERGILDKETAIKQLKVQELYSQILFHTEKSLMFCKYLRYETIGGK